MGRYVGLVDRRKLLLLIGSVFGFLLLFQYFELSYSSFLSSISALSKSKLTSAYGFQKGDASFILAAKDLTSASHPSGLIELDDDHDDKNNVDGVVEPVDESPSIDSLEEKIVRNDSLKSWESEDATRIVSPSSTEASVEEVSNGDRDNSSQAAGQTSRTVGGNSSETEPDFEDTFEEDDDDIAGVPKNNGPVPVSVPLLKAPESEALSISQMEDMLLQSRTTYPDSPRWPSTADQELSHAKSLVLSASAMEQDAQLDVSVYRNFSEFKRSYELMEETLKVYIYREGEQPIFHRPTLKGIYASEGWFMKLLKSSKRFVTRKPSKAHLFYMPFSSRSLVAALYVPDSHSHDTMVQRLHGFTELIMHKYDFWNRTAGSDHFLVACHDWAPVQTRRAMSNSIRALCNADVQEGFQFGKDASLPETYIHAPQNPLRQLGGKPPSQRRILAFFAGNMHGYLRPILLKHWQNKDPDMKIFEHVSRGKGQMSYAQYMKSSRYCICAKGYEVNSPRVVEAIFFECVPVIISDNFVPPFFEALNWESFAVFVLEKEIPKLKEILVSITERRYLEMQQRVKHVQQHFLWHSRPVRYDAFHMILHSVWYNRVFQTRDL